jgi:ribonuclease Z
VLIHEAAGASPGHTSAPQAAEIARQAEVGSLYLIHYSASLRNQPALLQQARQIFPGPVNLAEDLMTLEF